MRVKSTMSGNLIGLDLVDEIADVGAGHEGFSRTLKDDGLDGWVLFGFGEAADELGHDRFVQGVHGFRPVEGDEGDAVFDREIDEVEFERFSSCFLAG